MAVATSPNAYTTGIRKALTERGIANSQIGYNPNTGYVTVGGQNFMKADKAYNGATYTNQTNFNNAWNAYQQRQSQPQQTTTSQPTSQPTVQQYNPYSNLPTNPYTTQADEAIRAIMQFAQSQQRVDPYNTAQYQAFQAQSARRANEGIRAAQEALGSAGFGRSTALGERAQGIQNREAEYLETQVIPQILAQEEARRQQQFQNQLAALQPLLNQQTRADQQVQQDFANQVTIGDLTGTFQSPQLRDLYNQVLQQKQAYAAATTPEERQAANAAANQLRAQIAALGGDPNLVGANVNYNTALGNAPSFGIRTLGGQQQDLANRQANLNAALAVGEASGRLISPQGDWGGLFRQANNPNTPLNLAGQQQQFNQSMVLQQFQYQQLRDQIADEQWKQKFDEDVRRFGLQQALDEQIRLGGLDLDRARLALQRAQFDADEAYRWTALDNELAQAANRNASQGTEYSGMTPNQVYNALISLYGGDTGRLPTVSEAITPEQKTQAQNIREQAFLSAIDAGLPDAQTDQLLALLGFTKSEIAEFSKKYGAGK
jgi:hypothetical protein